MTTQEAINPTQAVFAWVLARQVAAPDLQHGRLVHLSWSAPSQGGRLVQWYLDGRWAGVTTSPVDRSAWLLLDAVSPHAIELLAVSPTDALTPMPGLLAGADPPTQSLIDLAILRDTRLPIDTQLSIALDDMPGESSLLFDLDTPRGGFGAVFGAGGFGYDASTGPGLGLGELGYGPLGTDAAALRWTGRPAEPGAHRVTTSAVDAAGRRVADDTTIAIATTRLPAPPRDLTLGSDLQLTWT